MLHTSDNDIRAGVGPKKTVSLEVGFFSRGKLDDVCVNRVHLYYVKMVGL